MFDSYNLTLKIKLHVRAWPLTAQLTARKKMSSKTLTDQLFWRFQGSVFVVLVTLYWSVMCRRGSLRWTASTDIRKRLESIPGHLQWILCICGQTKKHLLSVFSVVEWLFQGNFISTSTFFSFLLQSCTAWARCQSNGDQGYHLFFYENLWHFVSKLCTFEKFVFWWTLWSKTTVQFTVQMGFRSKRCCCDLVI